ncbi:MAG: hypothetical protein ACK4NW_01900 [Roseinatronobacter sp.]
MTEQTDPGLRFGNRRVTKMYAQINALRKLVASEGTPAIQAAWDKIEEHIDFAYQQAGRFEAMQNKPGEIQ